MAEHHRLIGGVRVECVRGDLTRESTDAIVNAANSSLMGGGGVDGAIHRAGGPEILRECQVILAERGPLPPGEAVVTTAGRMAARHVIHTVGPVWQGGNAGEAEALAHCYQSCLALAEASGLRSLAFPSISTGAYGYPVSAAATIALRTVRDRLLAGSGLELVRFVLFSEGDLTTYRRVLETL